MQTTTRRNIIAGAVALPLLPATALAVPGSAFAAPAESDEGQDFLELLDNLKKLPPDLRETIIGMVNVLADEQRKQKAGLLS